eukprot:TRINITY_DN8345_c0_g1_i1.p2 TRINITY_DN8345_c0_g1~~TRINITY_DN8345_c0_g1_i1.p2  ORF type:complete len:105 (-),score=1.08 TRINITY_DN8345_c0_g1_i1:657-971(-)
MKLPFMYWYCILSTGSSIHAESMGSNNVHNRIKNLTIITRSNNRKDHVKELYMLSIHFPDHDQMRKKFSCFIRLSADFSIPHQCFQFPVTFICAKYPVHVNECR